LEIAAINKEREEKQCCQRIPEEHNLSAVKYSHCQTSRRMGLEIEVWKQIIAGLCGLTIDDNTTPLGAHTGVPLLSLKSYTGIVDS
jgi:hypothetical protein